MKQVVVQCWSRQSRPHARTSHCAHMFSCPTMGLRCSNIRRCLRCARTSGESHNGSVRPTKPHKKLVFSHARMISIVFMTAGKRSRSPYGPLISCRDQINSSAHSERRSLAIFVELLRMRYHGRSCSSCSYFTGVGFCSVGGVRIWRENAVPCVEFKAFRSSAR